MVKAPLALVRPAVRAWQRHCRARLRSPGGDRAARASTGERGCLGLECLCLPRGSPRTGRGRCASRRISLRRQPRQLSSSRRTATCRARRHQKGGQRGALGPPSTPTCASHGRGCGRRRARRSAIVRGTVEFLRAATAPSTSRDNIAPCRSSIRDRGHHGLDRGPNGSCGWRAASASASARAGSTLGPCIDVGPTPRTPMRASCANPRAGRRRRPPRLGRACASITA